MRTLKASLLSKEQLFWMLALLVLLPSGAWPEMRDGVGGDVSGRSPCFTQDAGVRTDDADVVAIGLDEVKRASYNPEGRMIYIAATGSATRNVVTVQWETRAEPQISGFFVWRGEHQDGPYVRIHDTMIPGKGGDTRGGVYTLEDYDVVSGRTYYYKIQEIEESGFDRFYGPVASDGSIDWDEYRDRSRINISCFIDTLFDASCFPMGVIPVSVP